MDTSDLELFKLLQPKQANNVMDLVQQAGIDVSGWAYKQGGLKVKNPVSENGPLAIIKGILT